MNICVLFKELVHDEVLLEFAWSALKLSHVYFKLCTKEKISSSFSICSFINSS